MISVFDTHPPFLSESLLRALREAIKKKLVFLDIGLKGGWVPVSKHNFFYIRN